MNTTICSTQIDWRRTDRHAKVIIHEGSVPLAGHAIQRAYRSMREHGMSRDMARVHLYHIVSSMAYDGTKCEWKFVGFES